MKKVEIELYRYHNLLFGKVLYMHESLRGIETIITSEDEVYKIHSIHRPALDRCTLYLQGTESKNDDCIFSFRHATPEKAERAAEEFKKLIDKINEDPEAENEKIMKII